MTSLRRREANAAITTSNECNFSFQLTHVFLLSCHVFVAVTGSHLSSAAESQSLQDRGLPCEGSDRRHSRVDVGILQ